MSTPSVFERMTGKSINPLWMLRGFGITVLAILALTMLLFKTEPAHSFCIGLAFGLMVGLVVQLFALSSVEPKNTPQPSDVESLPVTR